MLFTIFSICSTLMPSEHNAQSSCSSPDYSNQSFPGLALALAALDASPPSSALPISSTPEHLNGPERTACRSLPQPEAALPAAALPAIGVRMAARHTASSLSPFEMHAGTRHEGLLHEGGPTTRFFVITICHHSFIISETTRSFIITTCHHSLIIIAIAYIITIAYLIAAGILTGAPTVIPTRAAAAESAAAAAAAAADAPPAPRVAVQEPVPPWGLGVPAEPAD